ncbi:MAG: bacillithiol biosynthesis deacetylase BshB1 [Planctomycetota bacterium]
MGGQDPDRGKLDALVVAAHPDDGEIAVGGTLLLLRDAGWRLGIVDLTAGELGTRGTVEDRRREAAAAGDLLGLSLRVNLGLPDGGVADGPEPRAALAQLLRRHRPEVLLAHHGEDLHPDHAAAGALARRAWYLAGLPRLAERVGGAPAWRAPRLFHFPGHLPVEPTLVVDVGAVWERKVELIRCYASQLTPAHPGDDGSHFLFGADLLARAETRARYWGERIGRRYGEPLWHAGPLPADKILPP